METVKTTDIIKSEQDITKFDGFTNIEEMKNFSQVLIDSKLIPFKTAEEAVTVALMGKELGIGFTTAMNCIYNIKGKPALSVHLATALAKRAGVDWQIEKDAEYIKDADGKTIDAITQIRFFRKNKDLNKIIENVIVFKWSEAVKAGYTIKDNWSKLPKNMMRSRCLMEGIRLVAPDVLVGLFYEASEIADNTKDIDYEILEDGTFIKR